MANNEYAFAIVFAIIFVLILVFLAWFYGFGPAKTNITYDSFAINGKDFNITNVAQNDAQREQGLMNDTNITNSTIMLFVFQQLGYYPFWMKNTHAQLDMIWINYSQASETGVVVYLANATPYNATQNKVCTDGLDSNVGAMSLCPVYNPDALANYVIEAKDGFVQRNAIEVGDRITLVNK